MTGSSSLKYVLYGLLLVTLIVTPLAGAHPVFAVGLLYFVLLTSAFNLLPDCTGLLLFEYAVLFGGVGYVASYIMCDLHVTPKLGLLAGTAADAFAGLIVGLLTIRRQGICFAMITLALVQMLYFFRLQVPFMGGEDDLQGVPHGKLSDVIDLSSGLALYYMVLAIVVAAFLLIVHMIHSPFGWIFKAIKENESRAASLDYDTDRFKLLAFVLSAVFTGLTGSLEALTLDFETLTDVHWSTSGSVILMALVGSLGILSGSLLGVALVIALENKLGDIGSFLVGAIGINDFGILNESVITVTGTIFVTCALMFRRGIMGGITARVLWL